MRPKDKVLDEASFICDLHKERIPMEVYVVAPLFMEVLLDIRDSLNGINMNGMKQ